MKYKRRLLRDILQGHKDSFPIRDIRNCPQSPDAEMRTGSAISLPVDCKE